MIPLPKLFVCVIIFCATSWPTHTHTHTHTHTKRRVDEEWNVYKLWLFAVGRISFLNSFQHIHHLSSSLMWGILNLKRSSDTPAGVKRKFKPRQHRLQLFIKHLQVLAQRIFNKNMQRPMRRPILLMTNTTRAHTHCSCSCSYSCSVLQIWTLYCEIAKANFSALRNNRAKLTA